MSRSLNSQMCHSPPIRPLLIGIFLICRLAADPQSAGNLSAMVTDADVIVIGEFLVTTNEAHAKAPIRTHSVLYGKVAPAKELVPSFNTTDLTVSPGAGSRWIFFLKPSFKTSGEKEYRRVIGKGYDYEGIVPASGTNVVAVISLIAKRQAAEKQGASGGKSE